MAQGTAESPRWEPRVAETVYGSRGPRDRTAGARHWPYDRHGRRIDSRPRVRWDLLWEWWPMVSMTGALAIIGIWFAYEVLWSWG
jgi:hypothetical protein